MKQRKLNEVFLDELTGRRLKCVPICGNGCVCPKECVYDVRSCHDIPCMAAARKDGRCVYFIQTDEPITVQP